MYRPLSSQGFDYWQEKFSHYWHGLSYDHRLELDKIFGSDFNFAKGALFCATAGGNFPKWVRQIELNNETLIDKRRTGLFTAFNENFFVISGENIHQFPFVDCQQYAVVWDNERIITPMLFHHKQPLASW